MLLSNLLLVIIQLPTKARISHGILHLRDIYGIGRKYSIHRGEKV